MMYFTGTEVIQSFTHAEIIYLKEYVIKHTGATSRQVFIDEACTILWQLDYIDITFIDLPRKRTAFYKHLLSLGIYTSPLPPYKYSRITLTKDRKYTIRIVGTEAFKWFNFIKEELCAREKL